MSEALLAWGVAHGRFQPFHLGHLEYLQAVLARCHSLVVGITNADPAARVVEATSAHRHRADDNPFSYLDRQRMVLESLDDLGVERQRVWVVPFPIHQPERLASYVPRDGVHFVRVFSAWEQTKVERLRQHGYHVEVLHPGMRKAISGTEVRRLLRAGGDWRRQVPAGTARAVEALWASG